MTKVEGKGVRVFEKTRKEREKARRGQVKAMRRAREGKAKDKGRRCKGIE